MFHHYILSMMHGAIFVEGNSCVFIFFMDILLVSLVTDFTRFVRYGRSTLRPYLGRCVLFVLFFLRTQHAAFLLGTACCVWVIVFLLFANSFFENLSYSWVREHHFFELVDCHACFDGYACGRNQL